MIEWTNLDIGLLVTLLPLLGLSAFFSCSETTFFQLGQAQLVELRQRKSPPTKAALFLVRNKRNVLITILIGNMTANVLYFVVSSVLMLHIAGGVATEVVVAVATLFSLVIFGEVIPKMAATARPIGLATLLAPPLVLIHKIVSPIRTAADVIIITPLSRLITTNKASPLEPLELASLVKSSSTAGIIDQSEQRVLFEVVELSRIRVREVMTPRVHMVAAPSDSHEDDIKSVIERTHLTQLPIFGEDLDDIVGMLHTKRFLQRANDGQSMLQASMTKPQFIPQVATLDQLLTHFRETKTRIALVVDEFGGTAGLVTLEDVLEELIGEIGEEHVQDVSQPKEIEEGTWLIDANTGVRGWAAATGMMLERCPAATMGGLIAASLGRIPKVGDSIRLGNIELAVASMDEYRVASVLVSLQSDEDEA